MQFVVRTDDLGWSTAQSDNPPEKRPDCGLALAQQLHDAMGGRPYLGALIPAMIAEDADAQAWLASVPAGLTLALHGWNHAWVDESPEFSGLTIEQCREQISLGQNLMRRVVGSHLEHFVAPFNAYCTELLDALTLENIRYAWGGENHWSRGPSRWHTQPPPYRVDHVLFIPSWEPLYAATAWGMGRDEPRPLLETLPGMMDAPGISVITLHLPWEMAHGTDCSGVRAMVEMLGDRIISPSEFLAAGGISGV